MAGAEQEAGRTRALASRARELTHRRYRLSVEHGADPGAEAVLDAGEGTVGTSPANALVLADETVSRHHLTVVPGDHGFSIADLGSTNGTWVEGIRIGTAYLSHGALIKAGNTAIRFEVLGDEVTEEISATEHYDRVLGASPAMRRIFSVVERVAGSDATILLEGETGTGKTLLADVIHARSLRRDQPFVVVDCGAIPPNLIESELFGHEKGAFTGAHTSRIGAFEQADGGTVFLDEIGELPPDLQPKLLRAIEDKTIKRVGASEPATLEFRLIAATNRDLRQEVNRGGFRSDLYYRLNTVRLCIPPLRERVDDIPLLLSHFYAQFAGDSDTEPPPEMIARFLQQPWRGNVRELRSAVERAVLLDDLGLWTELTTGPAPDLADSEPSGFGELDPALSYRAAKEAVVARFERRFVAELLRRHDGNQSQAARAARMDRNHLRELMRRHRIGARKS